MAASALLLLLLVTSSICSRRLLSGGPFTNSITRLVDRVRRVHGLFNAAHGVGRARSADGVV